MTPLEGAMITVVCRFLPIWYPHLDVFLQPAILQLAAKLVTRSSNILSLRRMHAVAAATDSTPHVGLVARAFPGRLVYASDRSDLHFNISCGSFGAEIHPVCIIYTIRIPLAGWDLNGTALAHMCSV